MLNRHLIKKSKYNVGIGFLRVVSSLMVVMIHCFNIKTTSNTKIIFFYINKLYSVPIFIFLSFYFMANFLININKSKLIKKLERLIIPYIIWPVVILALNKYLNLQNKLNLPHSFEDLKIQILYGWHYLFPLWYIYVLILYILLFIIIILVFNNHYLFILNILTIFSYIIQYSRLIPLKFKNKLAYPVVIRIPQHFQFAVLGFMFSSFKVMSYLEKHRFKTISSSLLLLYLIFKYNLFSIERAHEYSDLRYFFGTPPIFFIFTLFPFDYIIENKILFQAAKEATYYTMGVYTIHVNIYNYILNNVINYRFISIKNRNFLGCLTIYFFCYLISFLLNQILKKSKLKNLYS